MTGAFSLNFLMNNVLKLDTLGLLVKIEPYFLDLELLCRVQHRIPVAGFQIDQRYTHVRHCGLTSRCSVYVTYRDENEANLLA